jgi:hypothetical protein
MVGREGAQARPLDASRADARPSFAPLGDHPGDAAADPADGVALSALGSHWRDGALILLGALVRLGALYWLGARGRVGALLVFGARCRLSALKGIGTRSA